MKILITGATGRVGSRLVLRLLFKAIPSVYWSVH